MKEVYAGMCGPHMNGKVLVEKKMFETYKDWPEKLLYVL